MSRPSPARPVVALTFCLATLALAGCETLAHRKGKETETVAMPYLESEQPTKDESFSHPKELNGFFKANRSAGAWSSEAREIEASLGAVN